MKTPSLYLDSSILGGYFDEEFKDATRELWRQMRQRQYRGFCSTVVVQEISSAPEAVRNLMRATFPDTELLHLSREAIELANAYMRHRVVTAKFLTDARHVAIYTVERIDFLVSWNFRHLVNIHREAGFNAVNLLQGHPPVRIVSPLELIYGQEKKNI